MQSGQVNYLLDPCGSVVTCTAIPGPYLVNSESVKMLAIVPIYWHLVIKLMAISKVATWSIYIIGLVGRIYIYFRDHHIGDVNCPTFCVMVVYNSKHS